MTYPERQVVFDFDVYDRLEWFEGSRITFHGTGGLMEIGILPDVASLCLPEARNEWCPGLDTNGRRANLQPRCPDRRK